MIARWKIISIAIGFFLMTNLAFPYGKEFSFRVKVEPPELVQQPDKFQIVIGKINFFTGKNTWSEWTKVTSEDIEAIKKGYPNLYMGRYPLVINIRVHPPVPDAKIYLQYEVDGRQYSGEALYYGSDAMSVGTLQWEENGITKMGTMAQYNQKYWDQIDKAQASIGEVKRPEKLLIADRFIGGDSDFYDWKQGLDNLSRLGFNVFLMPADKKLRDLLLQTPINKISYAVYNPPGYAFDFDEEKTSETAIKEWAKNIAKPYIDAGYDVKDMALFALSDEPGWYFPSVFKHVNENPKNLERFHTYLKAQGLKPQDFGFKSWNDWDKVKPLGRSVANKDLPSKKLFYWTCRFFPYVSNGLFAKSTKAIEEAFYPGLPITVNWNFFAGRYYFPGPFAHNPDKKSPDAAMGSHDWLEFGRARGSTCMWTEDWFGDNLAYQWSFYCSKLKSVARKSNVMFGGYVIGRTAGEGVTQKMLAIFGHGGKIIKFYVFGPEYNFPGNCWSENPKVIKGIMRASTITAKAEEFLYPGKPLISKVAILTPQSSLVWDQKEMEIASGIVDATNVNQNHASTSYMAEVYNLYLALMHANIQVDFVDETDLVDSKTMANYRVLFVTAPNLPAECTSALQKWVNGGGILVTTHAAITADRYDEPTNDFYSWLGMKIDEQPHPRMILSWNKWKDSSVDTVALGQEVFKAAWAKGKMLSTRKNSEILATFSDGSPAIVYVPAGKGGVIHYEFYPGCSYFLSQIESEKTGYNKLPCGFSENIRNCILLPLKKAKIAPFVSVSESMIEAVPLVSEKGMAVTVLNWSGSDKETVRFEIQCAEKIKEVESVLSGKIPFVQDRNIVSCEIPIKDVDVLLLRK
ncbi:MAG TPA: beta-galactosidase trimerization domain-containing protein [bacterium]|nr:beta-galactosidase trimerization domain-containing protein [bacterium]